MTYDRPLRPMFPLTQADSPAASKHAANSKHAFVGAIAKRWHRSMLERSFGIRDCLEQERD